jgi:hypothetical protein
VTTLERTALHRIDPVACLAASEYSNASERTLVRQRYGIQGYAPAHRAEKSQSGPEAGIKGLPR